MNLKFDKCPVCSTGVCAEVFDRTTLPFANVGASERHIRLGAGAGAFLLGLALRKRGLGKLLMGVGLTVSATAVTGFCPCYTALGINTTSECDCEDCNDPDCNCGPNCGH